MNHHHNDILIIISTWVFALTSLMVKMMPILQFVSVCLAILLSALGIYKHLKSFFIKKNHHDEQH